MSTLLLALDGPLQSWGVSSRFTRRDTESFPTKSGIVGILAAALGRSREHSVEDLAKLSVGVRTDQIGTRLRDFQTEIDWRTGKSEPLTYRYYLADYKFLVGVEGPEGLLSELNHAISYPAFPLFLGRRSCPPARRIALGVADYPLLVALSEAQWLAAPWYRKKQGHSVHLSVVRDVLPGETGEHFIRDVPLSFDPQHRRYGLRQVITDRVTIDNDEGHQPKNNHDPFSLLESE